MKLLRRNPAKSPFGRHVLGIRETWERRIIEHEGIEEPNRIVLLSASAGAAVAVGTFGSLVRQRFRDDAAEYVPDAHGGQYPDRIVQFGHALARLDAAQAAYRVVTWGIVSECAIHYWRPNYELEIYECAEAFEIANAFEGEVPSLGEPLRLDASIEEQAERLSRLTQGTLVCMIGAAVGEPIEWDDVFVGLWNPQWQEVFFDSLSVAEERLKQLAPQGLPIWRDTEQ